MKQEEIDRAIAEALQQEKGKSRWHRASRRNERVRQARNVLNILFMVGFVAAIAIYFLLPTERTLFFSVGFTAMALKIVEFILRFMF